MRALPRRPRATLTALATSLAFAAALVSCEATPRAQVLVTVESDLRAPDEIEALVVRVSLDGRAAPERRFTLGPGALSLPGSFGVAPLDGEAARRASIEIDVVKGRCVLFTYRASAAIEPGRVSRVGVFLARQCAGSAAYDQCAPRDVCGSRAATCSRGGACVTVDPGPSPDAGVTPGPPPRAREVPSQGAAIAITPDDTRAVAASRRAASVAVFDVDLGARTATRRAVLTPLPEDAERGDPEAWTVVAGNGSDRAYVVMRRAQRVRRIDDLHGTPHYFESAWAPTGSEPVGAAITPSGRHLYVTNFVDGTLTVVSTETLHAEMTIDLNAVLARTGRLGDVRPRVGLAHPRAIVISNDGDGSDDDEVAYVTEFFAQARAPSEVTAGGRALDPALDPGFWDVARVGLVYRVPLATNVPDARPIVIEPVADTRFDDAADGHTGCFPNQLYAAALNAGNLYVTGVCASPSGPVGEACAGGPCAASADESSVDPRNFKTLAHAAVFVADVTSDPPAARAPVVLTDLFRGLYDQSLPSDVTMAFRPGRPVPDDARRRMPLLPLGLAFVPGDYVAYVLGYGSDAVYRVAFTAQGAVESVGSNNNAGFIDLDADPANAGRLPIGIAIGHDATAAAPHTHTALVLNADTLNVSVLNLDAQSVMSASPATAGPPADLAAHQGRRFFVTGRGRWSWLGQSWASCETCHPDGLSDGVTWFFARGPRQTPSLDGSFAATGGAPLQRLFGWNASFDEVQDLDAVVRNLAGGVGAVVHRDGDPPRFSDRIAYAEDRAAGDASHTATAQAGLNGSLASISAPAAGCASCSVVDDLDRLAAYVRSVRSPRAPRGLDAGFVAAGRSHFEHSCAGCHGTALWTGSRRFYAPSEAINGTRGLLRTRTYTLPARFPRALNPVVDDVTRASSFRFADLALAPQNDRLQCAARDVGTVVAGRGVAPVAVPVREVRQDMRSPSQGEGGFNPPPLVGLSLSAPYFHAGNARTLEELFAATFSAHHSTWCTNCYRLTSADGPAAIASTVAFLLSIDDEQSPPARFTPDDGYDPDLCGQWGALAP